MAVQWLLVTHGLVTMLVVTSFLCGRWPIFQGTIIERIHFFIAFGVYDYFRRFIVFVFGSKGNDAILSMEYYCCDRPNPILQAIYLAIIGGTYYLLIKSSFDYLPGHYLSVIHRYTSVVAVGMAILLFLLTSISDPGTVNTENVSRYLSLYPYDNVIYFEKECSTCKIPKPARHFLICIYGAIAIALLLAGRLKELNVIYILTVYYGIDDSFRSLAPHVVQWLLASYNTQILLMVFMTIVSLLLAGFFGYHAHLCLTNTTTNETYKWEDNLSLQRKASEAKASAAALKASLDELSREKKGPQESKWKSFFRKSKLETIEAVTKNNIYDKGIFHNIYEIIFPLSSRRSFSRNKSKSG